MNSSNIDILAGTSASSGHGAETLWSRGTQQIRLLYAPSGNDYRIYDAQVGGRTSPQMIS